MRQIQRPSRRAQQYTFGVEIECFLTEGMMGLHRIQVAEYHSGEGHLPRSLFPRGWRAERDSSLRPHEGDRGLEVISPILKGRDGIEEIIAVCDTLQRLGAKIYGNAALHIHVGVESVAGTSLGAQANWIAKLLHLVAHNEIALYAVSGTACRVNDEYWQDKIKPIGDDYRWNSRDTKTVAAQVRRARGGGKERAIRRAYEGFDYPDRYHSINIMNLFNPSKRTVEFRLFSGTIKGLKIVAWTQLCLALCERASEAKKYASWEKPMLRHVDLRDPVKLLTRLFYAIGWTKGKKDVHEPELAVLGLLTDTDELRRYKRLLRRMVRRFVKEGGI